MPDVSKTEPVFSNIRQGPQEPYITFTDHLQTVTRQIDLSDAEEVLFKSLAYENAILVCRKALI